MPVTGIELGYGGGASIGGSWVFITGGNITKAQTVPSFMPFSMPFDGSQRSKVIMGDGIFAFSGSINFDLTTDSLALLGDIFTRNYEFDVAINDGHVGYIIKKCKASSFGIAGSPQALVTGSLSFSATNDGDTDFETTSSVPYIFENELVKYWHTGAEEVNSYNINFSQTLTPVYLNTQDYTPAYIRGSEVEISINVTAWESWVDHTSLRIGSRVLAIHNGIKESKDFSYGSAADTGQHTYSYKGYSETDSAYEVFTLI